jgi:hypothetical protein
LTAWKNWSSSSVARAVGSLRLRRVCFFSGGACADCGACWRRLLLHRLLRAAAAVLDGGGGGALLLFAALLVHGGLLLDRIGQKLRELGEQIGVAGEESGDLLVDVLDGVLLFVVDVENLEKRLVDLRLVGEAHLDLLDVVARVVKLGHLLARAVVVALLRLSGGGGLSGGELLLLLLLLLVVLRGELRLVLVVDLGVGLEKRHVVDHVRFDLVARWQKSVEAENQIAVAGKELRDATNDAAGVDGVRFEVFHDVQELVVNLWLVLKLFFHLQTR